MTIAAGFVWKDGILICADREEASGTTSKRAVEKVVTLHADPWNMTVATAGSGAVADLAVKRLKETFFREFCSTALNLSALADKHEQIIIDVLTKVHEDHIWNNTVTNHSIKLIIGVSFRELHRQYLYLTQDNIPQPIENYCCTGVGEDLCTYFTERLYHKGLTKDEMILLAAFIFREVNAAVQFCGKGTDMVLLRPGKLGLQIYSNGVESIQKEIPEFSQVMAKFWDALKALPNWLTSIDHASEEVRGENPEARVLPDKQEQCSRCGDFFPAPVSLHHTAAECTASSNIKAVQP